MTDEGSRLFQRNSWFGLRQQRFRGEGTEYESLAEYPVSYTHLDVYKRQPSPPPEWLKSLFDAIENFFQWSAPAAKPLLWVGVAVVVLFLLYHFVPAFARWVDNLRYGRKAGEADGVDSVGLAEAGAARALLAEADALAAEGRFAEAVHLLLYRSVEDIEGRRPGLVKPAMTSRDLAEAQDLPTIARDAFSRICLLYTS